MFVRTSCDGLLHDRSSRFRSLLGQVSRSLCLPDLHLVRSTRRSVADVARAHMGLRRVGSLCYLVDEAMDISMSTCVYA